MNDSWPQAWTRAALEMCVLAIVRATGPTHGYDVAKQLRHAGLGEIKGGTLYPVLGRLEERGHLRSHWTGGAGGPGRKLVEITTAGSRTLDETASAWAAWTDRVAATVSAAPARSGHRHAPTTNDVG